MSEMSNGHSQVPGQQALFEDIGYEAILNLKPQQERFCEEYVLKGCCNAAQAYMTAYPKAKLSTARVNASKLLTFTNIRTRITQLQAASRRRLSALVHDYHEAVITIDRRNLLSADRKTVKPLEEWTEKEASILEFEQVSAKDGVRTLLKIPTRHQSAVEIARICGLHKDKVEMTGANGGPIETTTRPQLSREEWLAQHGLGGDGNVDTAGGATAGSH